MFLSKDFLDGPADASGPPWGGGATPSASSAGFPGSAGSTVARPFSASTGLGAAGGFDAGGGRDEDLEATPTSAASLRQKMLQQRQRALQKQRTPGGLTSGSMVMANAGLPASEAAQAQAQAAKSSTSAAANGQAGTSRPTTAASSNGFSVCTSSGFPLLDQAMSRMSLDEDEEGGLVMPDPTYVEVSKEEEARRRSVLAQELDERGICHVYDPTPIVGPGQLGAREVVFDVGTLAASEIKNFIMSPAPKQAGMIECRIIRERTGLNKLFPKYTLESEAGVFLMTAKKQKNNKTSNYAITMSKVDTGAKEHGGETDAFLGKLRSNFLGLEFTAFGTGLNPKKIDVGMSPVHAMQLARQEMVAVQYSSSLWGSKPRGPRKMGAVIPRVQPNGERLVCRTLNPDTEGLIALQKSGTAAHLIDVYQNKPPKWNEQIGAFVLNFNKRVTQASVKNFQLTSSEDPDTVYLQFGRVGKDIFNMDFRFPFSPFQAFAICLSSFDYKLCCE